MKSFMIFTSHQNHLTQMFYILMITKKMKMILLVSVSHYSKYWIHLLETITEWIEMEQFPDLPRISSSNFSGISRVDSARINRQFAVTAAEAAIVAAVDSSTIFFSLTTSSNNVHSLLSAPQAVAANYCCLWFSIVLYEDFDSILG